MLLLSIASPSLLPPSLVSEFRDRPSLRRNGRNEEVRVANSWKEMAPGDWVLIRFSKFPVGLPSKFHNLYLVNE